MMYDICSIHNGIFAQINRAILAQVDLIGINFSIPMFCPSTSFSQEACGSAPLFDYEGTDA